MIKTHELTPIFDQAKSFYGKAIVVHDVDGDTYTLRSYDTDVVRIVTMMTGYRLERLWPGYSATTMRHVREFVAQYGSHEKGSAMTKKAWDALPVSV